MWFLEDDKDYATLGTLGKIEEDKTWMCFIQFLVNDKDSTTLGALGRIEEDKASMVGRIWKGGLSLKGEDLFNMRREAP